MNYDPIPECVCGGTGTIREERGGMLGEMYPCGACIARYDANHCYYCDKRHKGKTYPVPSSEQRCCAECAHKAKRSFAAAKESALESLSVIEDQLRELSEVATGDE